MRLDGYGLFVKRRNAFLLYGRKDCEKRKSKKYEYPQKASGLMRWALTDHKFVFVPYQGCYYFCHYPTTNLLVFFRYFAGMGASNFHVMFMGLEPLCET